MIAVILCVMFGLSGCGGEGPESLLETAQFEEKQNNHTHARQLYRQIIESYPDSPVAGLAKKRLSALEE